MEGHFQQVLPVDRKNSSDQFLIALLELMKKKPYEEISITELCKTAGLSRNTFYKFFPEKKVLLDYLTEDLALGYVAYKKMITSQKIDPKLEPYVHYFSFWFHMRDWVEVLIKNDLWERIAMPNEKTLSLMSTRNWNHYLLEDPHTMEMMQTFIAAGCVQLVKWWSRHNYEKTPMEMAELVVFSLSGRAADEETQ